MYESECAKCNPPGTRKVADKDGLGEKREMACLYVGETARSVSERALEHWRDAETGIRRRATCWSTRLQHTGESKPLLSSTSK